MFDRLRDKLKPKIVLPIAGMAYGGFRALGAYSDSLQSGSPMTTAQLAGYALGALLVWGFAGMLLGYGVDLIDKRSRKAAETAK